MAEDRVPPPGPKYKVSITESKITNRWLYDVCEDYFDAEPFAYGSKLTHEEAVEAAHEAADKHYTDKLIKQRNAPIVQRYRYTPKEQRRG